jgi:catechol 2,3-dioxygenase-like lactoylglutathione lyase family enzyme
MVSRFDHVVIGVRDLDAAIRRYQHLGFDVRPGGRHTGRGTHNALIRFGLDYIELLSVYDATEAEATGQRGQNILKWLREREGLLLGYALATTDIDYEAERLRNTELLVQEPFAMQRRRPDGHLLTWRLLLPGGDSWRRPWPFLIQWDTPDAERLLIEQPGIHPNGATGWVRVAVAVHDTAGATDLYTQRLGLEQTQQGEVARLSAHRATFQLGKFAIDLLAPERNGPVQADLVEIGEGPFAITLAVSDFHQARSFLAQRDVRVQLDAAGPGTLLIDPQESLGVRIILTEQK